MIAVGSPTTGVPFASVGVKAPRWSAPLAPAGRAIFCSLRLVVFLPRELRASITQISHWCIDLSWFTQVLLINSLAVDVPRPVAWSKLLPVSAALGYHRLDAPGVKTQHVTRANPMRGEAFRQALH